MEKSDDELSFLKDFSDEEDDSHEHDVVSGQRVGASSRDVLQTRSTRPLLADHAHTTSSTGAATRRSVIRPPDRAHLQDEALASPSPGPAQDPQGVPPPGHGPAPRPAPGPAPGPVDPFPQVDARASNWQSFTTISKKNMLRKLWSDQWSSSRLDDQGVSRQQLEKWDRKLNKIIDAAVRDQDEWVRSLGRLLEGFPRTNRVNPGAVDSELVYKINSDYAEIFCEKHPETGELVNLLAGRGGEAAQSLFALGGPLSAHVEEQEESEQVLQAGSDNVDRAGAAGTKETTTAEQLRSAWSSDVQRRVSELFQVAAPKRILLSQQAQNTTTGAPPVVTAKAAGGGLAGAGSIKGKAPSLAVPAGAKNKQAMPNDAGKDGVPIVTGGLVADAASASGGETKMSATSGGAAPAGKATNYTPGQKLLAVTKSKGKDGKAEAALMKSKSLMNSSQSPSSSSSLSQSSSIVDEKTRMQHLYDTIRKKNAAAAAATTSNVPAPKGEQLELPPAAARANAESPSVLISDRVLDGPLHDKAERPEAAPSACDVVEQTAQEQDARKGGDAGKKEDVLQKTGPAPKPNDESSSSEENSEELERVAFLKKALEKRRAGLLQESPKLNLKPVGPAAAGAVVVGTGPTTNTMKHTVEAQALQKQDGEDDARPRRQKDESDQDPPAAVLVEDPIDFLLREVLHQPEPGRREQEQRDVNAEHDLQQRKLEAFIAATDKSKTPKADTLTVAHASRRVSASGNVAATAGEKSEKDFSATSANPGAPDATVTFSKEGAFGAAGAAASLPDAQRRLLQDNHVHDAALTSTTKSENGGGVPWDRFRARRKFLLNVYFEERHTDGVQVEDNKTKSDNDNDKMRQRQLQGRPPLVPHPDPHVVFSDLDPNLDSWFQDLQQYGPKIAAESFSRFPEEQNLHRQAIAAAEREQAAAATANKASGASGPRAGAHDAQGSLPVAIPGLNLQSVVGVNVGGPTSKRNTSARGTTGGKKNNKKRDRLQLHEEDSDPIWDPDKPFSDPQRCAKATSSSTNHAHASRKRPAGATSRIRGKREGNGSNELLDLEGHGSEEESEVESRREPRVKKEKRTNRTGLDEGGQHQAYVDVTGAAVDVPGDEGPAAVARDARRKGKADRDEKRRRRERQRAAEMQKDLEFLERNQPAADRIEQDTVTSLRAARRINRQQRFAAGVGAGQDEDDGVEDEEVSPTHEEKTRRLRRKIGYSESSEEVV